MLQNKGDIMKVIINNISIDKDTAKEYDLLPELLLEMGMVKGLDLDKPTSVYIVSHKVDTSNEKEFCKMFKNKK